MTIKAQYLVAPVAVMTLQALDLRRHVIVVRIRLHICRALGDSRH
jgi:hypothetical protein